MEARQELLLDLLGEPEVRYALPAYQRAYAWGEYQCLELWRDIMFAALNGKSHFAGMLISSSDIEQTDEDEQAGVRCLEVIDGQQRLTTISLALLAFAHYMDAEGMSFFGIDEAFIIRNFLKAKDAYKLTLSKADRDVLFAYVDGKEVPEGASSKVIDNLKLFEDKMAEPGFDAETFWRGLRSVFVISIELDADDDPQGIFESFNSKGVALTTADMMRNFLLMAESSREQTRLYEQYWERIQSAFGDDPGSKRLNTAIRSWMCVRCRWARAHTDREMFSIFKAYCEEELPGTIEDLLQELVNFSAMWAERYRYHYTKAFVSYNWAVLGPNTLVPQELVEKVKVDRNSDYWKRHMIIDSTK